MNLKHCGGDGGDNNDYNDDDDDDDDYPLFSHC